MVCVRLVVFFTREVRLVSRGISRLVLLLSLGFCSHVMMEQTDRILLSPAFLAKAA